MISVELKRHPELSGGTCHTILNGETVETRYSSGPVYQMIMKLHMLGLDGEEFEVHDGRMMVMSGEVGLKSVPKKVRHHYLERHR